MLQHSIGSNSGKYDQVFPVVSLRARAASFSSLRKVGKSTKMASLLRLCKHGMALITDAYFRVTSRAAPSAACISALFPPCLSVHPALGKAHAKSITQFLSAFLLKEQLSAFCMAAVPTSDCCERG